MADEKEWSWSWDNPYVQWGVSAVVVLIVALLAVMVYFAASTSAQQGEVAATVNGEPVYLADVKAAHAQLSAAQRQQFSEDDILEQLVEKTLVLQHAREQGISVSDSQVEQRLQQQTSQLGISVEQLKGLLAQRNVSFEEYREAVREELVLTRFVEEKMLPDVQVSIEDIEGYYADNQDKYTAGPDEVRIRHVLVNSSEEARDVYEQAVGGADFGDLASEYSTGPSADRGGDLGFVGPNSSLVEPFKEVALSLEVGEVSEPVETRFGFHVIKRGPDAVPLEDVRGEIEDRLRREKARQEFRDLVERLRQEASVSYTGALDGASLS